MIKKIIFIIMILILLMPVSLVYGNILNSNNEEPINTTNIQTDIVDLISQVNESILSYYLEKIVSFGFKKTGSENTSRAADWIKEEFENLGLYTYFDEWKCYSSP